ncbi:MAG: hypothetical protein ABSA62_14945 [Methyloceanibacter sp.]
MVSRAFSGRAGRSIANDYVLAATGADAPEPAPYPVQRGLTTAMRAAAQTEGDISRMQAWAGQSAVLARAEPRRQSRDAFGKKVQRPSWDDRARPTEAGRTTGLSLSFRR